MATRIEVVNECPHGLDRKHPTNWWDGVRIDCPGGSRRVLDPGSYVLIEKVDELGTLQVTPHGTVLADYILDALDALAGGES